MIDQWIKQLGSDNDGEVIAAEHALIDAGTSAKAPLINALDSPNPKRRWRASSALYAIGAGGSAVNALTPLLTDSVWEVKAWSTCALGMSGDLQAFDPLVEIALGGGLEEGVQYMAALGLLHINRERAVQIFQDATRHEVEQVRRTALSALAMDRQTN